MLKQAFDGLVRSFLFPGHLIPAPPGGVAPEAEPLWLETDCGTVEAWLIPGHGVSATAPGPLVVFAHGNGELIDDWPGMLAGYARMGVSLLLPEYRGYGRTPGKPSQQAIVADCLGWLDQVTARPEVDAARVVFHGRSIGGGVACAMAAERAPHALILQSTFTCIPDVAKRFGIPPGMICDPFDNARVIAEADFPCLILHGIHDRLIPFSHAERLHAAARNARLSAYDADHNSPLDPERYWHDIRSFLEHAGVLKPTAERRQA